MTAVGRPPGVLALLPVALFMGFFYFFPLWEIGRVSFSALDSSVFQLVRSICGTPYYQRIIGFTFAQAALSATLTVLAALPGAYILARHEVAGKRLFLSLITVPFVLPTVVMAAAFRTMLDPHALVGGALGLHHLVVSEEHLGLGAILGAHVVYNYGLAVRIMMTFWANLDPAVEDAARVAGATPRQVARLVTMPLLAPALLTAGLLVFLLCFSSFGVVLLLGGFRYSTLEVEIYRQAAHLFNLPIAALLSLLQLGVCGLMMAGHAALQRRFSRPLHPAGRRRPLGTGLAGWLKRGYMLAALAVVGLPLISLALESLRVDGQWSMDAYQALASDPRSSITHVPPLRALGNSLYYACVATVLAVGLGLCAALFVQRRSVIARWCEPLFMLPMTTSAVTLGFGFLVALDQPPLQWRSSWFLVPFAHALVGFPFVLRVLAPAMAAIPARLREAAAVLGAGPAVVWRTIDAPLLIRPVLMAVAYAFVISLGEFGATIFLVRPHTPTLPMAIYRFLSLPGSMNYSQAMAMSTLLMLICVAVFMSLERGRWASGRG